MGLVSEALGVDLVNVLCARRPDGKPSAGRFHLDFAEGAPLEGAGGSLEIIRSPASSDALIASESISARRVLCSGRNGESIRV
jgi:hypothetical protein